MSMGPKEYPTVSLFCKRKMDQNLQFSPFLGVLFDLQPCFFIVFHGL